MSRQKVKVRGQSSRSQRSKPKLTVSGLYLQFEFTYGDEMMHKTSCDLWEVPYCLSRSSVKFQCLMGRIIIDFDLNWVFPGYNCISNSQMAMKSCTKIEVYKVYKKYIKYIKGDYFSRSSVKFQGHMGQKITYFDPNWAFPDYNSILNSQVAIGWCTKLEVA